MGNLISMDLRRASRSPMFFISLSVIAIFNIAINVILQLVVKFFAAGAPQEPTPISTVISTPFNLSFLIILMFASLINFTYADIANGYIKNLAGQLPHKSSLIISKFFVSGIHNLFFIAVGSLTNLLGVCFASLISYTPVVNDGKIFAAIMTLVLKWMLSMAITAILMFVTNGIKSKVLASIVGVILGTGSLGLAYMGLNAAISNIFKTNDFDLSEYMPDSLLSSVNVSANTAVVNAVVVSLVCIAIFLTLTIKVFNSRDVK